MPLYKLFCISAHYPDFQHIKDLVTRSATLVLEHGSPVRSIEHLGTRSLPQKMRRHKTTHTVGDYWTMHFDAPPHLVQQLSSRLRDDPRVIRWTTLKLGSTLQDISHQPRSTRPTDDYNSIFDDDNNSKDSPLNMSAAKMGGFSGEEIESLMGPSKR